MSEIRTSTRSRLRSTVETPNADDEATSASPTTATTSLDATQATATQSTSSISTTAVSSLTRIGSARTADVTTEATTPVATTTSKDTSGAASFASNIQLISYDGVDSNSMTAAFMKLEGQALDTNQDMEGLLNLAKHHLREAAFKIERALADQDLDALLDEADQLEQQAMAMIEAALEENGGADNPDNAELLEALESLSSDDSDVSTSDGANQGDLATDAWKSLYDSASRQLTLAAEATQEAADATAKGDDAAAQAATERADQYEANARTILEAAGIDVSEEDADAMGQLALEMKANGDDSNVITAYVDQHPEVAQSLLTAEEYEAVKDQGGQAIVDAVMASQTGDASDMALGLAASAADQAAIDELLAKYPAAAAIQDTLAQAADLMTQAYELRIRAYQSYEALLDARNAIHEGKTDDGQFGVANRNARGQQEILKGLFALTGGTRADQQARNEAATEATRSRNEVSKLLLEYVDNKKVDSTRNRFIRS